MPLSDHVLSRRSMPICAVWRCPAGLDLHASHRSAALGCGAPKGCARVRRGGVVLSGRGGAIPRGHPVPAVIGPHSGPYGRALIGRVRSADPTGFSGGSIRSGAHRRGWCRIGIARCGRPCPGIDWSLRPCRAPAWRWARSPRRRSVGIPRHGSRRVPGPPPGCAPVYCARPVFALERLTQVDAERRRVASDRLRHRHRAGAAHPDAPGRTSTTPAHRPGPRTARLG